MPTESHSSPLPLLYPVPSLHSLIHAGFFPNIFRILLVYYKPRRGAEAAGVLTGRPVANLKAMQPGAAAAALLSMLLLLLLLQQCPTLGA